MQYKTVTGVSLEDIPARMQELFSDQRAYRGVPGAADLTDINTGFTLQRVTEVFGLKGFGWNFTWNPTDLEIVQLNGDRVLARLRYALFQYRLVDEKGESYWIDIPTAGANENKAVYAEEGARTSAMGAALKGLTFQLPVYQGLYNHHNAAGEQKRSAAPAPAVKKPAPETAQKPAHGSAEPADQAMLERAKAYKVPQNVPMAGRTLGEVMGDPALGQYIIKFLAGRVTNKAGQNFDPATQELKSVAAAAAYLLDHALPLAQ